MSDLIARKPLHCLRCDASLVRREQAPYPIDAEAKRVTMILLVSGHQCSWSFCRDCDPPTTGEEMRHFHHRLLLAMEEEGGNETIRWLFHMDIPLGVLCVQRWGEVT